MKILNHHRLETVFANNTRSGEESGVLLGELYCINTTHWAPSHVTTQKGLLPGQARPGSTLKDAGGGASWCRNIRGNYYRDGELQHICCISFFIILNQNFCWDWRELLYLHTTGQPGPLSLVQECRGFALIGSLCCFASSLMP